MNVTTFIAKTKYPNLTDPRPTRLVAPSRERLRKAHLPTLTLLTLNILAVENLLLIVKIDKIQAIKGDRIGADIVKRVSIKALGIFQWHRPPHFLRLSFSVFFPSPLVYVEIFMHPIATDAERSDPALLAEVPVDFAGEGFVHAQVFGGGRDEDEVLVGVNWSAMEHVHLLRLSARLLCGQQNGETNLVACAAIALVDAD